MSSLERVVTARLTGIRLRPDHLEAMCLLHRDPRVMATLGGATLSDEETARRMVPLADHWDEHGFGVWMFFENASDQFVGRCGVRYAQLEGRQEVELLYALRPPWWRCGLATEMSQTALRVAFDELGFGSVAAWTLPTNLGSRRVMERLGMQFERDVVWADLPHVLYRVAADDWRPGER